MHDHHIPFYHPPESLIPPPDSKNSPCQVFLRWIRVPHRKQNESPPGSAEAEKVLK